MAEIIYTDGSRRQLTPAGTTFQLDELQHYVGGFIEIIPLGDQSFMIVDEDAIIRAKQLNIIASIKLGLPVVGDVIILKGKEFE